MPNEYIRDGDTGFIGLNSRDNPSAVPAGFVTQSQNFRLDRGVATVRKGLQRKTTGSLSGVEVYGSGVYLDANGQEVFVFVVSNGLFTYNPQTESLSSKVSFPAGETITSPDGVDVLAALGKVFITRGFSKRPLVWDMGVTITVLPSGSGAGHQFPSASGLIYYGNRLIAIGKQPQSLFADRNSVSVSNYLTYEHWDLIDSFTFNDGSNDDVVAVTPWTLNEFLVFMRNSIQYVNVGSGGYTNVGDGLASSAFVKTLTTDAGCAAKRTAVQVAGGVMFLSDNGVYFLQPQNTGANEGMRLLTVSEPVSAPIDDVIKRINRSYVASAVASYWGNRYYLAVPLNEDPVEKVNYVASVVGGSTTITATSNNHKLSVNDLVVVSLATNTSYNGTFLITSVIDENTFSFTILTAITPVSGTFTYYKESRINNAILVYNFILQSWESVDTYPSGFNATNLLVGKRDNQRRLFAVDKQNGIFLTEQLDWDEYGPAVGTPVLNFFLTLTDDCKITNASFTPNNINSILKTRRYTFNETKHKRFSSFDTDLVAQGGSNIETYIETINPDTEAIVDNFASPADEDSTRKNPIRKIAYGLQGRFETKNLRPSIRAAFVKAVMLGKNNQNTK